MKNLFLFAIVALIFSNVCVSEVARASQSESRNALVEQLVERLVKTGWTKDVARAVVQRGIRQYEIWAECDPVLLDKCFIALGRLPFRDALTDLLRSRPQLAGLLLLSNKPEELARVLGRALRLGPSAFRALEGTFARRVVGWEIDAWAAVVERHGKLIARMILGGVPCPDSLFSYPTDNREAAESYGDWLESVFETYPVAMGDSEFGALFSAVFQCGGAIHQRMQTDEKFRRTFANELWPCIRRIAMDQSTEEPDYVAFMGRPEVWDLLMDNPRGEELLRRAGMLSVELLLKRARDGDPPYPDDLHPLVEDALLKSDWRVLDLLEKYRCEPLLHSLMRRQGMTSVYLFKLLTRLGREGANYPNELANLATLSNEALFEDLAPERDGIMTLVPGYSTYYMMRKAAQGRTISGWDYFGTAMDIMDIAGVVFGVPKSSLVLKRVGKEAALEAAEKAARQVGESVGDEIAAAAEKGQLLSWAAHCALARISKETREQILRAGVLDVTEIVRSTFQLGKRFGLNNESYKVLSKLDAKVFMRRDGRVFFKLASTMIGDTVTARFLNQVAEDALEEQLSDFWDEYIVSWWQAHAVQAFGSSKGDRN